MNSTVTELLGRVDIEPLPGKLENALAHPVHLHGKSLRQAIEHAGIDAYAGTFHAEQDGREGQVDFGVNTLQIGSFHFRAQRRDQRINGGRGGGQLGRRSLAIPRRHVGKRLRCMRGIERIREQHAIIHCAAQRRRRARREHGEPASSHARAWAPLHLPAARAIQA